MLTIPQHILAKGTVAKSGVTSGKSSPAVVNLGLLLFV